MNVRSRPTFAGHIDRRSSERGYADQPAARASFATAVKTEKVTAVPWLGCELSVDSPPSEVARRFASGNTIPMTVLRRDRPPTPLGLRLEREPVVTTGAGDDHLAHGPDIPPLPGASLSNLSNCLQVKFVSDLICEPKSTDRKHKS